MKILATAILSLTLLSSSVACYNDSDSRYYERFSMPNDIQLSEGDFPTHSKYYFEWKIKDRLNKIEKDKTNLDLYDDLAVAYEKSGQADKGIAVMLSILKNNPDRYSSLSNLGTFYIHIGKYDEGLKYLKKAIEINPKAHFERERYQIKTVEYIQSLNAKPPFNFPVQNLNSGKDFADFILQGMTNKDEQEKELIHALVGVSGMIKFGMKNSSLLMEMMGDLYLKIKTINNWNDPDAIKSYNYLVAQYYLTAFKLSIKNPEYEDYQKIEHFIEKKSSGSIEKQAIFYAKQNFNHYSGHKFEQIEKEVIDSGVKNVEEAINEKMYPGSTEKESGQTKDLFEEKYREIQNVKREYLKQVAEHDNLKRKIYKLTQPEKVAEILPIALLFLFFGYLYEAFLFFTERKKYTQSTSFVRATSSLINVICLIVLGLDLIYVYLENKILMNTDLFSIILGVSMFFSLVLGLPFIYQEKEKKEYYNTLKLTKAVKYSSWVIRIFILVPILLLILHLSLK